MVAFSQQHTQRKKRYFVFGCAARLRARTLSLYRGAINKKERKTALLILAAPFFNEIVNGQGHDNDPCADQRGDDAFDE